MGIFCIGLEFIWFVINRVFTFRIPAIYLTFFMMITTLSVACAVFVIKLHYTSPETDPPQWLRVLLFNYIARLVRMDPDGKLRKLSQQKKRPAGDRMPLSRDVTTLTWPDAVTGAADEQSTYPAYTAGTGGPGHDDHEEMYELRHTNCTTTPVQGNHDVTTQFHTCASSQCSSNPRHRPQTLRGCCQQVAAPSGVMHDGNGGHIGMASSHGMNRDGGRLENNIPMDLTSPCTPMSRSNTLYSVTSDAHHPRGGKMNEWKKLADILDRFLFYMFLMFLIIPTATILGIVRLFKPEL